MNTIPVLIKALTRTGTPPCASCPNYSLCATDDLSCEAFYAFVVGSTETRTNAPERVPSRDWWRQTFKPVDAEEFQA